MVLRNALFLLWMAVSGALLSTQVSVSVSSAVPAAQKLDGKITFTDPTGEMAPVVVSLMAGQSTVVDLSPRRWIAAADFPGFWAPERVVSGGGSVSFALSQAGKISGRFPVPEQKKDISNGPRGFVVELLKSSDSSIPAGAEGHCAVEKDGTWNCPVPLGKHDLRVRPDGRFIPIYLWDVSIVPDKKTDLGLLDLRVGASVSGLVENAEEKTEIALRPYEVQGLVSRTRVPPLHARPDARHFFVFAGVPPGKWVVELNSPGYVSTRFGPISVYDGVETRLPRALQLLKPGSLELAVQPPVDPDQRPWHVTVDPVQDDGVLPSAEATFDAAVKEGGSVSIPGLRPGRYRVSVRDAVGNPYVERFVEVFAEGKQFQVINVPLIRIEGRLRYGKSAAAGALIFGGQYGNVHVAMKAGRDGAFEGFLPEGGNWTVTVTLPDEKVETSLRVVVDSNREGTARVEITVPNGVVKGKVIDAQNTAVADALVSLGSATKSGMMIRTRHDGSFEFRGVPPGQADLQARKEIGDRTLSSLNTPMTVEADTAREVTLQLEANRRVTGFVFSGSNPVPGASVLILPDAGTPTTVTTEADGSFALEVSEPARSAVVIAQPNGYALTAMETRDLERPITLEVQQAVGSLEIPIPGRPNARDLPPFNVLQNGVRVPIPVLARWALRHGGSFYDDGVIHVPALPSGRYELCPRAGMMGSCVSGNLVVGATLQLALPGEH